MADPRPLPPSLEEKRQAAIAYLGPRYVNHPQYAFIPRHSANPAVYITARAGYLLDISRAATQQRRNNLASLESRHASHA